MTKDQVKRVEIETSGQSTNDLWYQQRTGRVTASSVHTFYTKAQSILNRRGQNYKTSVYSSLESSLLSKRDDVSHLPQIKWGTTHEKDAIKAVMSDVVSQYEGGMVGLQGFNTMWTVHQAWLPIPCSFTRWLMCKYCGLSIVEAKCPYSVRNENIPVKETFDRVDFLEDFHGKPSLRWLNRVMQDHEARASDLNRKLIFSFFLLFS